MNRNHVRPVPLLIALALSGCFAKDLDLETASPNESVSAHDDATSPDAGEGAKAKVEEGVLHSGEVQPFADELAAVPPPHAPSVEFESAQLGKSGSASLRAGGAGLGGGGTGIGGLIGAKGKQVGAGGMGTRSLNRSGHGYGSGRMAVQAHGMYASAPERAPRRAHRQSSHEEYTDHGVNPFTLVSNDALSTFSIDVDTASYTMARRKLKDGVLPSWEGVRAEEFINFFDYEYRDPSRGPFAVDMEAMPDPFRDGRHIMRVGVQAKRFAPSERPPLHLTFLVDVSGSMSSRDKLGLAKTSMHTLVDNLQEGDTVAMATYAGRTARILEPTDASEARRIHRAIDALNSGGSTAMSSGIDMAYEMADEAFESGAENRVIILSDGDANVGGRSWEGMLKQIKGYADQGITLSTIGYGQGNYRDTLMEQLANKGDGNNFYVDSAKESDRIFGEKIGGTMITVARDTKIQVEFNPEAVSTYRLIGYENRDIADKDFRNDRVDAGEVGSGHSVTALYEVNLVDEPEGDLATVRIRWEEPGADKEASERAFAFKSRDLRRSSKRASDDTVLAYAAATFAEVLRQSPHAAEVDMDELKQLVTDLDGAKDARELARLMGAADRLGVMESQAAWHAKN